MATTYKLSWLFLRSLERGVMSELGLAQSEIAFRQYIQHKKDCHLWNCTVTIHRWYNSLSPTETRIIGRFWKMAVKTDFGILYHEDRRPPYRKQKTVIQRPLVRSSGCWDLGVNAGDALGGS